jgi:GH15 family glucan-1,4-alpha-glucosidase
MMLTLAAGDDIGGGPIPAWRAAADKLRQTILDRSWDENAQTLSEHLDGGGSLDASLLALPLRRVLPASHPRMVATATATATAKRLSARRRPAVPVLPPRLARRHRGK